MKNQIHIEFTHASAVVIDIVEDESIDINLDTWASKFFTDPVSPKFAVRGLRWRDGKHYHLTWMEKNLALGEEIKIHYRQAEVSVTALAKVEEYVAPEPTCSFCDKRASEVEVLVERGLLARICNECVQVCQEEIQKRRS
jgi:ClpX C4-type zinc finger